ncbi:MalY/PatB family protein [Qingshengfaniella alkalisoli]|uniref:cysteine-S-conjugate beta-lyase n=1 Tax=Qingshengfaniella alkalisoli TaxID=2599296 RepID=A0A5B8I6S7_9RHOB|nr:MalY/PatB family protein [Qingshengfaniella alkalisoli]QDY68176.1 pyridoxal phosphate-dependent aminotransferase [Qingshengfaniella alkalisoli]
MSFDELIDRRRTHCSKWDKMETLYGVSPEDGLAMWVADMDFRPPKGVGQAVQDMVDHGVYGYYGSDAAYRSAIKWWMDTRHGWMIDPDWIFTSHGLVNGVALCLDTYTDPGDEIVLFTPVYHAFHRVIRASGREVLQCELVNNAGRYEMDFSAYDAQVTDRTKMVILCSPHNPGGRVWTRDELQQVADFCKRHDLLLISDEIHHDLVYPDNKHVPMSTVDPQMTERLIMMTAATKTFNIAGSDVGNVIIECPELRKRLAARMSALGLSPNAFGLNMVTAAYTPEGAAWVDELVEYLDANRKLFDAGINHIPGLSSMPLEGTYLSWVDFSGTGMAMSEMIDRVQKHAKIAASHGDTFGQGGESFLRFNIAMPRRHIEMAVERLQDAFSDLQ